MSRVQVASIITAFFLIGSHCLNAAPQTGDESQTVRQDSADSLAMNPSAVNVLKANLAKRSPTTAESRPIGFWIQGWRDPQQSFSWSVESPQAGEYSVDVLVSGVSGTRIEIAGPSNKLSVEIPEGNDHWGNNWNKIGVPGWLALPKGTAVITVQSPNPADIATNKNTYRGMALLSLELIELKEKADLNERIRKLRSSAKWLADAQYGLMFQWGEWGYPEHGEGVPWPKMIDNFDVEKFANMVQSTGAGYVIWSSTWQTYYFPAPIQAIEQIEPGRISKRDLIGELADALNRRGIKLILYYHCGYGDREWSARNLGTTDPDKGGQVTGIRVATVHNQFMFACGQTCELQINGIRSGKRKWQYS